MRVLTTLLLAVAFAFGTVACSKGPEPVPEKSQPTFDDVKKQSEEALKTIGDFTSNKLKVYQKQLLAKLDEMDKKVVELQRKMEQQAPPVQEKVRENLKDLAAKIKEARAKFSDTALTANSAEAWEKLKAGAETLFSDLGKAYKDVLDAMQESAKGA
jgi:TolA-binding protein